MEVMGRHCGYLALVRENKLEEIIIFNISCAILDILSEGLGFESQLIQCCVNGVLKPGLFTFVTRPLNILSLVVTIEKEHSIKFEQNCSKFLRQKIEKVVPRHIC